MLIIIGHSTPLFHQSVQILKLLCAIQHMYTKYIVLCTYCKIFQLETSSLLVKEGVWSESNCVERWICNYFKYMYLWILGLGLFYLSYFLLFKWLLSLCPSFSSVILFSFWIYRIIFSGSIDSVFHFSTTKLM